MPHSILPRYTDPLLISAAHHRWTGLSGEGSRKHWIRRCCISSAVRVCVCVWGERLTVCAHPCSVSGERSLIQQYSAENITGAISSTTLLLISLIIILLTYCTAICFLQLERSYCKLRTSFSSVCFPSESPRSPSLCIFNNASHPHNVASCVLFVLLKRSKLLTANLFTSAITRLLELSLTREIWPSTPDARLQYPAATVCCLLTPAPHMHLAFSSVLKGTLTNLGKFHLFFTFLFLIPLVKHTNQQPRTGKQRGVSIWISNDFCEAARCPETRRMCLYETRREGIDMIHVLLSFFVFFKDVCWIAKVEVTLTVLTKC